jgi:hypothetical protein
MTRSNCVELTSVRFGFGGRQFTHVRYRTHPSKSTEIAAAVLTVLYGSSDDNLSDWWTSKLSSHSQVASCNDGIHCTVILHWSTPYDGSKQ